MNVGFSAGNAINLDIGFQIKQGAVFDARIANCVSNIDKKGPSEQK